MNKTLRNCLFGMGLALLVSVAAAQENFVVGGVAGVRGLHGHAVLPPGAIFSNCGTGCTSYNTTTGIYISGTGFSTSHGGGQTVAIGFSAKTATKFVKALTPNAVYIGNGGASKGRMSAFLLNGSATAGPSTKLAALVQSGVIPDFPSSKVIRYTLKKGANPVTFKPGKTYFFCETEPVADVQLLWMLSSHDTSNPYFYQFSDSCTAKGLNWINASQDGKTAVEIN